VPGMAEVPSEVREKHFLVVSFPSLPFPLFVVSPLELT